MRLHNCSLILVPFVVCFTGWCDRTVRSYDQYRPSSCGSPARPQKVCVRPGLSAPSNPIRSRSHASSRRNPSRGRDWDDWGRGGARGRRTGAAGRGRGRGRGQRNAISPRGQRRLSCWLTQKPSRTVHAWWPGGDPDYQLDLESSRTACPLRH
jgi:hypothetical protein